MNIARPRPPTTESTSKPPAGRRKLGDQPPDNNTNNSRGKSTRKKNNANRELDQLGFTSIQVNEIKRIIESSNILQKISNKAKKKKKKKSHLEGVIKKHISTLKNYDYGQDIKTESGQFRSDVFKALKSLECEGLINMGEELSDYTLLLM